MGVAVGCGVGAVVGVGVGSAVAVGVAVGCGVGAVVGVGAGSAVAVGCGVGAVVGVGAGSAVAVGAAVGCGAVVGGKVGLGLESGGVGPGMTVSDSARVAVKDGAEAEAAAAGGAVAGVAMGGAVGSTIWQPASKSVEKMANNPHWNGIFGQDFIAKLLLALAVSRLGGYRHRRRPGISCSIAKPVLAGYPILRYYNPSVDARIFAPRR